MLPDATTVVPFHRQSAFDKERVRPDLDVPQVHQDDALEAVQYHLAAAEQFLFDLVSHVDSTNPHFLQQARLIRAKTFVRDARHLIG